MENLKCKFHMSFFYCVCVFTLYVSSLSACVGDKVPSGALHVFVTKMPDNAGFALGRSLDGKTDYHLILSTPALKKKIHLQLNNILIGNIQPEPDAPQGTSGKSKIFFLVRDVYEPTDCI